MDARFRIRTREGGELEPRTVEMFSEQVRSGKVRPDDLVFDALTGEWAPARVHPMVRLLLDPMLDRHVTGGPGASHGADEEIPPPPADPGLQEFSDEPLVLDLVEEEHLSPEEEAQAFIQQMEEERLNDQDEPALARDLPLVQDRPGVVEGLVQAPPPAPKAVEPLEVPFPEAPEDEPEIAVAVAPPVRRRRHRRSGRTRHWLELFGMAFVGILGVMLAVARSQAQSEDTLTDAGLARAEAPRRARGVTASEQDVREAAFDGFLREVDGVRGALGLGEVPAVWLEGRYLSGAVNFPEVRRFWERAEAYPQEVRSQETELYRTAFLAAAEGFGLSGPVRSLRLAKALEDFGHDREAREGTYDRMGELAAAALSLHDVLVQLDGRVTYEPIRGRKVSADPVLEAAGTDPEAQALLEMALDRVLSALHGPDGSPLGNRNQVSGWLVDGLEEAGRTGARP